MPEDWILRQIYEQTGDVPLAVNKDFVVCSDQIYLYIDTGIKPEKFVEESEKAATMWMKE